MWHRVRQVPVVVRLHVDLAVGQDDLAPRSRWRPPSLTKALASNTNGTAKVLPAGSTGAVLANEVAVTPDGTAKVLPAG
jgi:hypothetical protein